MNKELQNALYEKYPKIFVQKDLGPEKTCMCWGIECGDGWYKLIDQLCKYLQFYTDRNSYPQIEARQVKEKFGQLRFYVSGANEYQQGCIRFAEHLSLSICEACGAMDDVKQTDADWIKTRCAKCLELEK